MNALPSNPAIGLTAILTMCLVLLLIFLLSSNPAIGLTAILTAMH